MGRTENVEKAKISEPLQIDGRGNVEGEHVVGGKAVLIRRIVGNWTASRFGRYPNVASPRPDS